MIRIQSKVFIVLMLHLVFSGYLGAKGESVELYMPDGQLIEDHVLVYVSGIDDEHLDGAQLYLINPQYDDDQSSLGTTVQIKGRNPTALSKNYKYSSDDNASYKTGTLLLFNLSDIDLPWYFPGRCVLPMLRYNNNKNIVAKNKVYISHRKGAVIFTVIIIAFLLILISLLVPRKERYLWGLLCTADGRMSISLTQVFLWTVAIGASVLIFGVTRLVVPEIHASLWVLMGLSATTSVVSHYQTDKLRNVVKPREQESPSLYQLISVKLPDGKEDADLSRAQLLFWTVITITIFIMKSYNAGELWDVPPAMLILMGISQTGFVTRKGISIKQLIINKNGVNPATIS